MNIEDYRKQLIYRSWHRGCKETDMLLGDFAKEELESFSDEQLNLYAQFITEDDWDIYAWLVGKQTIPEKYQEWLIEKIRRYSLNK